MKLFQKVLDWFRKWGVLTKQYSCQPINQTDGSMTLSEKFVCEHGRTEYKFKVIVLGVECEFEKSPMCPRCTEQYLNKFSTLCASCKQPIFPGTPVGQAWDSAPHPYVHLTLDCCESGALYCGRWGEGRLVTLHELNPEKYPAGTASVLGHAFNTGSIVIENM